MAKSNSTKDFYVYVHRKATTGQVFYVGKGHGKRAFSSLSRNRQWKFIVAKHGYTVEIVQDKLQEWYAFELEIDLIAYYGRETLANLSDGGEGLSGYKHTEESKVLISKNSAATRPDVSFKKSQSLKGRVFSDDHKENLSKSMRGRKCHASKIQQMILDNPMRKQENIEKMRNKKLGVPNLSLAKKIIRSDGVAYESMASAARILRENGKPKAHPSSIHQAISGIKKSAYGFTWKYA